MESASLVSILIPCYNSEVYISETIQSALNQTWPNIEIIIVDDGSSDESYTIAKSFESYNVKVYQQQNSGTCVARNLAFEKSSGDYIQYLDADDLLALDKIEQQMQLFEEYGNKIICSGIWGRFYRSRKDVQWEEQTINQDYSSPVNWLVDSWNGNGMAQTSVWLSPRHLIKKTGPWDESLLINQDGEFFSRVLMHAQAIKFAPEACVYYRSGNAHSITQNNPQSRAKAESLLKSYQSYERVLSIHDTPEIRKALGNNYLNFIYHYYTLYPDLTNRAEIAFKELGLKKMWPVGGKSFQKLVKIVGFRNALKIKKIT